VKRSLTGKMVRRFIRRAGDRNLDSARRVRVSLRFNNPRLFDELADFGSLNEESGVYVIYCLDRRKTTKTRFSRILYIGRGWVGSRLKSHLESKPGFKRFAAEHTVKFAFVPVFDEDWEFVIEGILLNEHYKLYGCRPHYNGNLGSRSLVAWHDVISLQPGPRRILTKYGA
jgi:hypothetical protein